MKRIFTLSLFLSVSVIMTQKTTANPTTIAVLDFENHSLFDKDSYNPLSKGLSEIMITELSRVGSLQVVERRKLQTLLDELKLSQSGLLQEETLNVGKILGAEHLLFGAFMVTMHDQIRIDLRIVDTETGLTVKADQVTGKTSKILSLMKKLGKKIIRNLNIKMTSQEEKTFDASDTVNFKAMLFYSQGLVFEDSGDTVRAIQSYERALEIGSKFPQATERLQGLSQ